MNTMIVGVRAVDISIGVYGNSPRGQLGQGGNDSIRVYPADAAIIEIGNVYIPAGVNSYAGGLV